MLKRDPTSVHENIHELGQIQPFYLYLVTNPHVKAGTT